ncbi:MAG: FAD-binding oxidoreductase [Betaproteobacteria bacterium]|nr:FAD-binding oxidoreductase [Betaproteobacteria bacterium]
MPKRLEASTHLPDTLAAIVGGANVLVDPAELAPFLTDWRGRYQGRARALVRPGNTEEVAAVVRACLSARIPIVPQGGNTGLCGGATPDESGDAVMLQLRRMNRARALDLENNVLIAEAGCTLLEAQAAARNAGRLFPLSLASEGSCQIGGNLATNAGGVRALRYGVMRDLTLGVEAILPDGKIWSGLHTLRKNNAGYDLSNLLIGSEGTLGIFTAAALKLYPLPQKTMTCWLGLASPEAAIVLLDKVQAAFDSRLVAFEMICPLAGELMRRHFPELSLPLDAPWSVLCELSDCSHASDLTAAETLFAECLAAGELSGAALSRSLREQEAFWRRRECISEAQKQEGDSIKHDIALPISRVAEFLRRIKPLLNERFPGIRHTAYGHLGDGNLHFNLSMPDAAENERLLDNEALVNRIVYDCVDELGGSISAEHGIGQLKREMLCRYKSAAALSAMRIVKTALDPRGIMNPGKVLPQDIELSPLSPGHSPASGRGEQCPLLEI